MGIYSNIVFNRRDDSPIITDTIESIMEDGSIVLKDENEDFVSEGFDIISSITENYNTIMQHVGVSELNAIYTTGDEMIYTENVVTDFLSGIKKFLMKIWEKIKSLFKRFIMVIDSYTKNDKAFINKYRQQIYRHKSLSDFTFKGYQYTIDTGKIKHAMEQLKEKTDTLLENPHAANADVADNVNYKDDPWDSDAARKYDEKHDDRMEELRGAILNALKTGTGQHSDSGKGRYTSEEFRKEIDMALRHGEEDKEELTDIEIDVDEMVTELQNYRETKKTVDTAFRDNKKLIDENIKTVDRLFKDHIKDSPSKENDKEPTVDEIKALGKAEMKKLIDASLGNSKAIVIDDAGKDTTVTDKAEVTPDIAAQYIKDNKLANVYTRSKSKKRSAMLSNATKVTNESKTMLITLDSCVLKALKERSRQYKACLVKIVYHNPKNESTFTESYDYNSNYGFNNYISSINFK